MRLSERGLARLAILEGFRGKVYRDVAGFPTIGHGHLLTRAELLTGKIRIGHDYVSIRDGQALTQAQALRLLAQDVEWAEQAVRDWVSRPLMPWQFDCLVVFVINVGEPAFARSTLVKRINAGDLDAVPAQLRRWIYAGGKPVKGLVNRREAEIRIWGGHYA